MRRAARTDSSHAEIVKMLRAVGAHVVDLSSLGDGAPDLLVGHRRAWHLIEVKSPEQPRYGRRLRKKQQHFHALCRALGLPCHVVTTPEEALTVLGVRFDDGRRVA